MFSSAAPWTASASEVAEGWIIPAAIRSNKRSTCQRHQDLCLRTLHREKPLSLVTRHRDPVVLRRMTKVALYLEQLDTTLNIRLYLDMIPLLVEYVMEISHDATSAFQKNCLTHFHRRSNLYSTIASENSFVRLSIN